MTWSKTPGFQTLCRFVLFFFLFSLLHPATLGMPGPLSFQARTADAGHWLLDFWRWISAFGPTPAYAQDALLASTPDANTSDPFIVQKAAELGHDPQRLFAFVRDEIGYESYKASLRGARGTLWSKAGNALDKASLLIALLRASGVPARYVQGTLSDALAKDLILSMFPPVLRVVGCLPADAKRADPANDPQLLTETREHYWVEFNTGGGFQEANPTFKDAQIGQTFTAAQGTFAEVPDNLHHKVTVRLKAEITGAFTSLARVDPDIKIPLNKTFNTAELVGKPLSIGHFVNSFSPPALLFGYTTHTYSPYILIGKNDSDISDDSIIRGEDYQEFLSNFPLSSQFLTGLFLEMDVIGPGGKLETFERTLVDRIGFATRQNGGNLNLGINAEELSAISEFDIVTVNVSSSRQIDSPLLNSLDLLSTFNSELGVAVASLHNSNNLARSDQERFFLEAKSLSKRILSQVGSIGGEMFLFNSDISNDSIEKLLMTKAYTVSPRLTVSSTLFKFDSTSKESHIRIELDLIRVVPQ